MDRSLNFINPRLKDFGALFGSRVNWPTPISSVDVIGITFGADPSSKAQLPPFRLERDAQAAFDDARYFSAAPLTTEDHWKLLLQLEGALGA